MEKEMRERMNDEKRFKKHKNGQDEMKNFLRMQMEEKKNREGLEKEMNQEQATMWK